MVLMIIRPAGLLLLTVLAAPAASNKREAPAPLPSGFTVGRRTFFDIGPPFEFYEIFSIRPRGQGTEIQRITLTPPGDPCTQPATVELATASTRQTIVDLLGGTNPCAIPGKELRRELKRCKKCLVFSGADVTMAASCGKQLRLIRMDILDFDMFDLAPKTPQHTSWTMELLGRLDQLLGHTVMDRLIFTLTEPPQSPAAVPASEDLNQLKVGALDALFPRASQRPSALYVLAQNPLPRPSVELVRISPLHPLSNPSLAYPPLARVAHIAGEVAFESELAADGSVSHVRIVTGHPLLQRVVESEIRRWKFQQGDEGRKVQGAIEFKMSCAAGGAR
jgi:hypothetical protein